MSGQAIVSGQGSVSTGGTDQAVSGSQSSVDQGSSTHGQTVRLKSRKVGGGAATFALGGSLAVVSIGAVTPTPQIRPSSVAALLSAGSLTKSRNVPLSGSSSASASGAVVGNNSTTRPGTLSTTFTLTSSSTGTKPFAIGHAFAQGDVSSLQGVAVSGATAQVTPKNYWSDGSLKYAIVAGTATLTANVPAAVTLAVGTPSSGTGLTTADLRAAMAGQTCSIDCGTFGVVSWATTDFDAPFQSWVSGHLMSSWIYRKAVGSDAHLVAWLEVRLYSTGAVEVFPWMENGYTTVASPTNKSATYTFTLGSTARFSQAIDIKHHTRIPLVNTSTGQGSATSFSHWLGADPAVLPAHDAAYFCSTKLIPNIGAWGAPSATILNATQQTYTPNTLAGDTNADGSTGGSGSIMSPTAARYITSSGDSRAFKAMVVHALSSGSWSLHYRDPSTNLPPSYTTYATAAIGDGTIPIGTGGQNASGASAGGTGPAITHTNGYAYVPYLVTGRWWFLEEMHFWSTYNFLTVSPDYRNNASFVIDTVSGYTVRGGAWALNLAAQSAAITPTTHPLQAQFVASWENSMTSFYGKYVSGTLNGGSLVSPIGVCGSYASNSNSLLPPDNPSSAWWDGIYQHNYVAAVLGYSSDLGIPQSSTSATNHAAVRNQSYKLVIGRADDGLSGHYNWRRFICFGMPVGTDAVGLPVDSPYSTHAQAYAELVAGYGLNASLPSTVGLSLKQHSSDTDLTNGDSSRAYGASALAALAMAVDHGATNAAAGYQRITGASNYVSSFSSFLTDDDANWSVKPRTPSWLTPVGTVADLTTNTLDAANGSSVGEVWAAYSGAAWAPWWGEYGSLVASGGGHTDGDKNYVFRVDVGTRTVTKIKNAASVFYKADNYCADQTTGWLWADSNGVSTAVQTGEPFAEHHYGHLLALPPDAISGRTDAANGWLYTPNRSTMPQNAGRGTKQAHMLRLGLATTFEAHGTPQTTIAAESGAAYDPLRGRVWYKAGVTNDPNLYYRILATGAEGSQAFTGASDFVGADCMVEYSRADDLVLVLSWNQTFKVLDPATGLGYTPTKTGSAPTATNREAWSWSDAWRAFVVYPGSGNTFYFLKPTGDPRTAAWAWSSQTVTGTVYAPAATTKGYNRLRHCAALGNVLIWGAATNLPVQMIHVNAP